MPEQRDLEDHEHIDDGLKLAFVDGGGSVLDAIEGISGTRARILLRDAPDEASPMLRVPGPREEGAATDDSRYQIVGEIARGGVGVVYKGRDKDLGRDVALKVLRTEFAQESRVIQRFIEEAQVGAQLQHPGIVPIYGLGLQADGKPYFAMKLIKGETLTELIEQGDKTSTLIGVFERIVQTVAYAHSRGVIHRDLKPSNVLVGAFGETQVVDWGFAKVLGRDDTARRPDVTMVTTVRTGAEGSQSIMGSVMGTPAYMPPEQAMGQIDELTARSDVFSLGAILCEILTRRPPYTGTMQDQLLAAAQTRLDEAYARLSECNAPRPLKQLARDCMAPLPKDRPKNAGVVAKRLADHLASVEDRARQAELEAVQAAADIRKSQRARRTTVALAAVVLVALVGGGLGYTLWSNAEKQRIENGSAKVTPLLREATRLEGLEEWSEAIATAAAALSLAQSGGADEDTLRSARALHARIDDQARNAAAQEARVAKENGLLDTLDELTLQMDDFTAAQLEQALLAAFRGFGVDVDSEDATAALLDFGRPGELAVHLDMWTGLRQREGGSFDGLHRIARAIDDDAWRNRLRDAVWTTDAEKRLTEFRSLSTAADVDSEPPASMRWLAAALDAQGESEAAVAVLNRARVRHPGDFWVHWNLAHILEGRLDRATPALVHARAALALRPHSARGWDLVGALLVRANKDYPAAERAFRQAVRVDPEACFAYQHLAVVLLRKGDLDGAMAASREAIRLHPDHHAAAHATLGACLQKQSDLDGAIDAFREAIRIDPKHENAHTTYNNLGACLLKTGDIDGAIAACRKAIRLDPKNAGFHSLLGKWLWENGDFKGAAAAWRASVALGAENQDAMARAEALAAAQARLPAFLAGTYQPASTEERLDFAVVCVVAKDYATAVRIFDEALREDPALASDLGAGHRYNAACAAARAGGQWHDRALAWLRADLDAKNKLPEEQSRMVAQWMRHWLRDPDLASVRDADDIGDEWRQLWADVAALLERVSK